MLQYKAFPKINRFSSSRNRALPVEGHLLGLHLPVLDIYLVSAEHDRDVVTHSALRGNNLLTNDERS